MTVALFLIHVAVTLMVAGMMWFVQVIHYPLLRYVGGESFEKYETNHTRLAIMLVVSLMLIEVVTGGFLVWWRPSQVGSGQVWIGLGLLVVIWMSTMLLQVPQHKVLAKGFDEKAYGYLVSFNWIRTVSYTARVCLMMWIMMRML